MNITFEPLNESHFSLMLKWLETPHVKKWWDQDITYTMDLVREKFGPHTSSLRGACDEAIQKNTGSPHAFSTRDDNFVQKPVHGYIIHAQQTPTGYIQVYNAHDFAQENGLDLGSISGSICGVDLFIGDSKFLRKGIGPQILNEFERQILASHFDWCLIDPAKDNATALKAFAKAGFKKIAERKSAGEVWMLKQVKENTKPRVGLGVLIFNEKGQILLGKRTNSHGALSWGPPGGHLEFAESFEACATRETLEETGLNISSPKFLAITNDLFEADNKHYISVFMKATITSDQKVQNLEPHKVEEWNWITLEELPDDLFLPLKQLLSGKAYGNNENLNNQTRVPATGHSNKPRKTDTVIVYLTGKPGVGKYTIAKALAKNYGFIICDNQLINNPIFELLQYDGYAKIPNFAWDSIARLRTEIFKFLTKVPQNSYVLTNNLYENDGDKKLYEQVKHMAHLRGSLFVPVRLLITAEEHLKRVVQPERRDRWKSIDPKHVYDQAPLLSIAHPNLLELDISNLSAENAAREVANHINKLKP